MTASNFEAVQMPAPISSSNVPTGAAPTISSLSASATTITLGSSVILNWQANGASYYFVNPQAGPVRGTSVVVDPAATTTYTLTATNAYGRNTASITIQAQ